MLAFGGRIASAIPHQRRVGFGRQPLRDLQHLLERIQFEMQETRLYIGNLPFTATEEDIRDFFSGGGHAVESVQIITDRESGRSTGFGFATLMPGSDLRKAEQDLNGQKLDGRSLTVNPAKPREQRPAGGGDRRDGSRSRGFGQRESRW